MRDYAVATESMNQADWNRNQEELTIENIETMQSGNLNITVKNTGSVHSTVIWIGLFNQSSVPEGQWFFEINQQISPNKIQNFISPFTIIEDQQYIIQLVTAEGNIYDYQLNAANEIPLALNLIVGTPTAYIGNNITLFLTVTNNNTYPIQNVTVALSTLPSSTTSPLVVPTSLTIPSLAPGSSTFFNWVYHAIAEGTVLFEATYNKIPQGFLATASVTISKAPTTTNSGQGQVAITGTSATAPYHPTNWTPLSATTNTGGTIPNLFASDGNAATFSSYWTGIAFTDNQYIASNPSDTDNSPNIGAISNFAGMQNGPDGNPAIFTEESLIGSTGSFGNLLAGDSYSNINNNRMYGGVFSSGESAATVQSITFYGRSSSGSKDVVAIICDNTGHILPSGISNPVTLTTSLGWWTLNFNSPPTINSNTNYWLMLLAGGSSVRIYYSSATDGLAKQDTHNNFVNPADPTDATSSHLEYSIYATTTSIEPYRLDFESQWTNIDTQTSTLCIYLTGQSGAENLAVDVRTNGAWENLIASLSLGWNNITITTYLTSPTFTIRFIDTLTAGDLSQNSWTIDSALIQQTNQNDQYTAIVELSGTTNNNTWTSLIWAVESKIDTDNAQVIIQFYNFSSGSYVDSESGYASYQSIDQTNNLSSNTLTQNPDDLKNATGGWKLKITATKDTSTPFNLYIDWIEINPTFISNGNTIPYGATQDYTLSSTSSTGGPTPYVYISIYVNGTNITLQDSNNQTIANPAWVQLDANGNYRIRLHATSLTAQSFTLFASVGTTVGERTILQEAQ